MGSKTPITTQPRESWGRLISTLVLVLAVLGVVLYGSFQAFFTQEWSNI